MTRMLNAHRREIREAILADVPKEDYDSRAQSRAHEIAVSLLPTPAKIIWQDASARGLLDTHSVYLRRGDYVPGSERYDCVFSFQLPGFEDMVNGAVKSDAKIKELALAKIAQEDKRAQLHRELDVNLRSVGTHEEFVKRWPELAKYLPDNSPADPTNLPATTALLDDLKAAGLALDVAA